MFGMRKINRDNDIALQFLEKIKIIIIKKTLKLDIYDKHLSRVGGAGRKKSVRMVMLNDLEIYFSCRNNNCQRSFITFAICIFGKIYLQLCKFKFDM